MYDLIIDQGDAHWPVIVYNIFTHLQHIYSKHLKYFSYSITNYKQEICLLLMGNVLDYSK